MLKFYMHMYIPCLREAPDVPGDHVPLLVVGRVLLGLLQVLADQLHEGGVVARGDVESGALELLGPDGADVDAGVADLVGDLPAAAVDRLEGAVDVALHLLRLEVPAMF